MSWFLQTRVGRWVALAAVAIAALVASWLGGRKTGQNDAKLDRAEDNADAAKQSKEIRHELETSDDAYLVDVLSGRVPPGKR